MDRENGLLNSAGIAWLWLLSSRHRVYFFYPLFTRIDSAVNNSIVRDDGSLCGAVRDSSAAAGTGVWLVVIHLPAAGGHCREV